MRDAVTVGNDDRRPVVRLGFEERIHRLLRRRAHGNLRHVDVPVRDRHQAEILLRAALPARRELRHAAARGRLGSLAAGVRVDLGVEDEDVDVPSRGQHVVQATVADVVRPPVAADNPDALAHEMLGEASAGGARPGRSASAASARAPPRGPSARQSQPASSAGPRAAHEPRLGPSSRRQRREQSLRLARAACRATPGSPARTRRCPRRASSPRPARGPPCSPTTGSSAGCRRRWRSSRSRWRRAGGRRRAASGASGTASRRSPRRRRRTRRAA